MGKICKLMMLCIMEIIFGFFIYYSYHEKDVLLIIISIVEAVWFLYSFRCKKPEKYFFAKCKLMLFLLSETVIICLVCLAFVSRYILLSIIGIILAEVWADIFFTMNNGENFKQIVAFFIYCKDSDND